MDLTNKALLWEAAELKYAGPVNAEANQTQVDSAVPGLAPGQKLANQAQISPNQAQASHEQQEPHQLSKTVIKCLVCSRFCHILPGKAGFCGVRVNNNGQLYSLTSNQVAALNLDPVEKKPLYHFYPGSYTLSLGTEGCNFSCQFCQNHSLAHDIKASPGRAVRGHEVNPAGIVAAAMRSGAQSISYTYSEPTIFFELMLKTARVANDNSLKNIMVSNAYQSPQALEALKTCIQAANFDLKAYTDTFYQELCGARLAPVLDSLKRAVDYGWWVEITTLLIPGKNDSAEELFNLATFIREELGRQVPWHISRYRPCYKLKIPPTTPESLARALAIGKEAGLDYVYVGNIPGHDGENTYCPKCNKLLVHRVGYEVELIAEGVCPNCNTSIPGEGLQ